MLYVALLLPSHLYELLPITVLIGTIFNGLARPELGIHHSAYQWSGPWLALRMLLALGLFL